MTIQGLLDHFSCCGFCRHWYRPDDVLDGYGDCGNALIDAENDDFGFVMPRTTRTCGKFMDSCSWFERAV